MVSRFYQLKHGLPMRHLLEFDNLHKMKPAVPRVLFSHNNYLRAYLEDWDTLNHFSGKKVVMLVRDPRDVAVSQFFQWKYRMRPHKIRLNQYPAKGEAVSTFEFVTNPVCGVPRIVEFFNGWARALPELKDILIIRYEDMRVDPVAVMQRVLDFVDTPGTPEQIEQAVEFASYRQYEKAGREACLLGQWCAGESG